MTKLSLEKAFNSYFHNIYSFSDFCNTDMSSQYTNIFYSKNTFSLSDKLKYYQQFLNRFLFNLMDINENVLFSYRKGVNIYDAVYPHKDNKYIFTTDIKSFFENINQNDIKKLIIKNKQNFLIKEEDIEKYIDILVSMTTFNNMLPIGAPSSPKLSNAYLFELDNQLEIYAKKKKLTYTRYADDFIFSSNQKYFWVGLTNDIENMFTLLNIQQLKLNNKKTKIQKKGSRVKILGLVITPKGNITVDKERKKEIEVLLHFYLTDKEKFEDFFCKNFNENWYRVSGKFNYIKSIDKEFILKLKRKYGNYIVNAFTDGNIDG